jgi:hypothetical protein
MRQVKPTVDDTTRDAVLTAFNSARSAGREDLASYGTAVDAWLALHPNHKRTYAAQRAIAIIHESLGSLLGRAPR